MTWLKELATKDFIQGMLVGWVSAALLVFWIVAITVAKS